MRVSVPDALVVLGQALDARVQRNGRRVTMEWRRPHWLCTDASRRVLWILPAPTSRRRVADPRAPALRPLAKVFRLWSDLEPSEVNAVKVRTGGEARFRGSVVRLAYRSAKWSGKRADYEHDFEGPARMVQLGRVYRISGGFMVKPAGITG